MKQFLAQLHVPGVVWILILMFASIAVAWYLPQFAVFAPFLMALIGYLINKYAPEDTALRELAEMVKSLIGLQAPGARDVRVTRAPAASSSGENILVRPRITEKDVDEIVAKRKQERLWLG